MPTASEILGFGNQWYLSAAQNADQILLPSNKIIHLVSAPYFLITKLEAFEGRGHGDYLMSHDIEDIIAVLDGRPELTGEVKQSDPELVKALAVRFATLQNTPDFIDAVSGHMPTDEISQKRVLMILEKIKAIATNI